jgi:hypothetical protein
MHSLYIVLAAGSAVCAFVAFMVIGYRAHWRVVSTSAAAVAAGVLAAGLALAIWFAGRALAPDDLGAVVFGVGALGGGLAVFFPVFLVLVRHIATVPDGGPAAFRAASRR